MIRESLLYRFNSFKIIDSTNRKQVAGIAEGHLQRLGKIYLNRDIIAYLGPERGVTRVARIEG